MATIHDVARVAAVAPSTVSLVANGRPYVKEATRKRVEAAMRQLGYRGRAKRQAQPARFPAATEPAPNIVLCYTRDAVRNGELVKVCREAVNGVRQVLAAKGAQVNLFAGAEHVDKDLMFRHCIEAREFDGIVLVSPQPNEGYLEVALSAGVPVVTINRQPRHTEFSSVGIDYYGGGRTAAEHFLKLGHKRLAIITTRREHWPSREYQAGFVDVLAERGLEPVLDIRPQTDLPDADEDQAIVQQVLDAQVTGVFAGDPRVVSLAKVLGQRGIDVPRDVSLIGLDHLGLRTDAGRRLTSIRFPKQGVGRMAARLMLRLLREPRRFQHANLTMPTALYRGQTTGPAPEAVGATTSIADRSNT